jgi:hypothetical protein
MRSQFSFIAQGFRDVFSKKRASGLWKRKLLFDCQQSIIFFQTR